MLVNCPDCKNKVSDDATTCPHCGRIGVFQAPPEPKPHGPLAYIITFGVLFGIGSCMYSNAREHSANKEMCIEKGIKYFKEIGAYPRLTSTGQLAEEAAEEKCGRTVGAFGELRASEAPKETPVESAKEGTSSKQGKAVVIPTDSKATYEYLEIGGSKTKPTLLIKRTGPSGVSYAKRLFNCVDETTKYLGEGDTLEEIKTSKPDKDMGPIIRDSIVWYHYKKVCK
ncbi:zinc ribbon domain-containing protein [Bdellovibrio sp. HCB290]|uniref:zinc ribbon domain-containing protein n=1 Tax=Bdellovibrio sp. HCB290 TaxID=3394356 RepID=UPI0039B60CE1